MDNQPNEQEVETAIKEELAVRMGTGSDVGHDNLLNDLNFLFRNAFERQYHDHNETVEAPKVALVNDLADIIKRAQEGVYDNK